MNKKIYLFIVVLLAITMTGCTGSKKTNVDNQADSTQVADMHHAENSLDYYGEYKGTIPAADCPGINVTLVLNAGHTYTLNYIYIDREGSYYNDSGTFSVEGNILTMTSKSGGDSYYKVQEGSLVMLNADKEEAEGVMKDKYVLKKV